MRQIGLLGLFGWCFFSIAVDGQAAQNGHRLPIQFHGNQVIIDEIYRSQIKLGPRAKINKRTAATIQSQLTAFLRRSGYSLAWVRCKPVSGAIRVEIDEGRLERIVFLGRSTINTLRMKMEFDLPFQVFNRPLLERKLNYLKERHGLSAVYYQLVSLAQVDHPGPQLDQIADLNTNWIFPKKGRYELRIHMGGGGRWRLGSGIDLEYDFPDGFVFGGHYRGRGLIFDSDRFILGASVGLKFRSDILDGHDYLALSRLVAQKRWYTPSLVGDGFRPFIWFRSALESRQRSDLLLEIYYRERLECSLNLSLDLGDLFQISIGSGVEGRFIFGVEQDAAAAEKVGDRAQLRPFVASRIEANFQPNLLRLDRRHRLVLDVRQTWLEGVESFGKARFFYSKVFGIGWHDLRFRANGAWLWGKVLFEDEEHVGGRYVRGVFGDRYFVKRVFGLSLEFRFSLVRDVVKVGAFSDLAVLGKLDRINDTDEACFATSSGFGFHLLILDAFQFDLYYGIGFAIDEDVQHGPSASLKKVF